MRVAGNCLKYLKRGWNRKEGKGYKDFKKGGGKLSQGVGALKRGRLEPPYELWKPFKVLKILPGLTIKLIYSD